HVLRPPTPLPIAVPQPTHLTNLPHCCGHLKMAPRKAGQLDVTEMVHSYWGSVLEPLDTRTQGTEAHTSTLYTVDTTHPPAHHELPYQVAAQA
ncbi:hypothetical protein PAXRUDRAFT_153584, partial [Paxillus rubicundulus Ve08.2h10]